MKSRGIDTVVDCTAFGHGRDVDALQRINEQVDINIVACTGIYTYDYLPFFFVYGHPVRQVDGKDIDILTEMFVRDVTQGIAGSGVKAGMIKTATDHAGVTPNIERILRAVARAHRETGAPITTHTVVAERNGLDQQRIFAEEGVDLRRVVIGHSGDSTDLDYLRALLDAGLDHRGRPLRPVHARHGHARTGRAGTDAGPAVRRGVQRPHRALPRRHLLRRLDPEELRQLEASRTGS